MSNPINLQRISLGKLRNDQDISQLIHHLQQLYSKVIPVVTGSGAPKTVPPRVSSQYIDTTNNQVYVATGNTLVSHWVKVS